MTDNDIKRRLDGDLRALDWTPELSKRVLKAMKGEIKVKKRMTFAMAVALMLLILSVTALAVTQGWLGRVGEMFSEGKILTWGLEEKVTFITAMRENGYDMDEDDYALLTDEKADEAARNVAADSIIDARYGDLMRERAASWIDTPDTVVGMMPDPTVIFYEAFFKENPDASMQDYVDELDRWQRDALAGAGEVAKPTVDEAYVREYVRGYMTEVCCWDAASAEQAEIDVSFNSEYNVWEGVARLKKSLLSGVGDMLTEQPYVLTDGDCYVIRAVIAPSGQASVGVTAEEFVATPTWNYTADELRVIAAAHLTTRFNLNKEQVDKLFIRDGDAYIDEYGNAVQIILFKPHSTTLSTDWQYAVIVSGGTGVVLDSFTPDDLWDRDRIAKFATAYADMTEDKRRDHFRFYGVTYNLGNGFRGWSHEHRALFGELFKPVIDAMLLVDPDFNDFFAVEATRRVYGVPGANDLTEIEASALALRAVERAMGLEEGDAKIEQRNVACTFDVTDAQNPVWRFLFLSVEAASDKPFTYFVSLNARTGGILEAYDPHQVKGWTAINELL